MKNLFSTSLIILLFLQINNTLSQKANASYESPKQIHVRFNNNIEFLGFVFHMAWIGPEELGGGQNNPPDSHWRAYGLNVYQHYLPFSQSSHLAKIKEIGYNLDYGPVVRLMFQIDDFPHAKMNDRITEEDLKNFSPNHDADEGREIVKTLLDELNLFYEEVNFDQYMLESEKYYQAAMREIMKIKPDDKFIPEMENFYQKEFSSYTLVPSLLIPTGMGFGQHFQSGDSIDIYDVFGSLNEQTLTEDDLNMGFTDQKRMLELSIHEFGHSFVNPVVDQVPDSLIAQTSFLFDPIAEDMYNQGYNNWKTCLYEHFVRAGEVVISSYLGNKESAENLKNHYINDRKFIYLPQILEILEQYHSGDIATYENAVIKSLSVLKNKDATSDKPKGSGSRKKWEDIRFHTEDVNRFWKVFDETYPDLDGRAFQEEYFDQGSKALKFFIPRRLESGAKLGRTVKNNLEYYQKVRESTLNIDQYKDEILAYYKHFLELYPQGSLADIYFLIGRLNTGGTAFDGGIVMGAEMFGILTDTFRPRINIQYLDEIVAHELVHFNQNYPPENTLLAQVIREGSADFLRNLIVGETPGSHISAGTKEYVKENHEVLWQEFLKKKEGTNYHNWLYTAKKDRPRDLGYWLGFMITKYYYDKAKDKKQAIYDILNISDFERFLKESGYDGEYE